MKKALIFAAVGEAATGMALLIVPSLVGRLLLGEELGGAVIPVARVAGIALIGLGIACWPGPPLVGMLIYSAVVTLYLAYLGFAGGLIGALLWPASPSWKYLAGWRPTVRQSQRWHGIAATRVSLTPRRHRTRSALSARAAAALSDI